MGLCVFGPQTDGGLERLEGLLVFSLMEAGLAQAEVGPVVFRMVFHRVAALVQLTHGNPFLRWSCQVEDAETRTPVPEKIKKNPAPFVGAGSGEEGNREVSSPRE